jgi:hypothetical protein
MWEVFQPNPEPNWFLPKLNWSVCCLQFMPFEKIFPKFRFPLILFRSWVAVRVIDEIGPIIVNDISGGTLDSKMFETIGKMNVPYVLTHIQGTPQNMQENPIL